MFFFFFLLSFFFNDTATTEIYPLSLHDALPISNRWFCGTARISRYPALPVPAVIQSADNDRSQAQAGNIFLDPLNHLVLLLVCIEGQVGSFQAILPAFYPISDLSSFFTGEIGRRTPTASNMERMTGIEPAIFGLGSRRVTNYATSARKAIWTAPPSPPPGTS